MAGETGETYSTTNDIDGIVLDDTFAGTSTTKATLSTPLYRATRAYVSSGDAMPAASKAYIYASAGVSLTDGVPQTASAVKLIVSAAEHQSLKASTSLSSVDYAFVTEIYASINKKTQGGAVIRFKVRQSGGVFRTLFKRGINSLGPDLAFNLQPHIIIPKNADIVMTAEADQASTPISGGFNSVLASVVS